MQKNFHTDRNFAHRSPQKRGKSLCFAERGGAERAPRASEQQHPERRPGKDERRHEKAQRSPARPHAEQKERGGKQNAEDRIGQHGRYSAEAAAHDAQRIIDGAEQQPGQKDRCQQTDLRRNGRCHTAQ